MCSGGLALRAPSTSLSSISIRGAPLLKRERGVVAPCGGSELACFLFPSLTTHSAEEDVALLSAPFGTGSAEADGQDWQEVRTGHSDGAPTSYWLRFCSPNRTDFMLIDGKDLPTVNFDPRAAHLFILLRFIYLLLISLLRVNSFGPSPVGDVFKDPNTDPSCALFARMCRLQISSTTRY